MVRVDFQTVMRGSVDEEIEQKVNDHDHGRNIRDLTPAHAALDDLWDQDGDKDRKIISHTHRQRMQRREFLYDQRQKHIISHGEQILVITVFAREQE